MAKLYIGNTAYKVMLGSNSAHFMRGVYQNTTNNTFISRQTGGGNLTIDATNGKVLKVEGNSVAWNQLVKNGDFSDGTTGWTTAGGASFTVSENKAIVDCPGSNARFRQVLSTSWNTTHKYFVSVVLTPSISCNVVSECSIGWKQLSKSAQATERCLLQGFFSPTGTGSNWLQLYANTQTEINYTLTVEDVKLFDLTLLNYPNIATTTPTVEQVEEWLANNVEIKDYYPYGEGSILNVKMLGIKTTLPNVWTETKDFDVTRVYGKLNGEGSYVQIYPDGMRGVNDVKDVIYLNEDRAECKVGNVDLGSFNWSYYDNSIDQKMFYSANLPSELGIKRTVNLICSKYIYHRYAGYTSSNKTIKTENNRINATDLDYTDANSFKSANQGVPLIYELATPLSYTNLMYDQSQANDGSDLIPLSVLTYRVDANGTEEIIRPTSVNGEPTSLAPTMDIKYINANIK